MHNNQIGSDQRGQPRANVDFPVTIRIGTQISVKAQLKDISLNSAFIKMKNNIYMASNDEINLTIQCSNDETDIIEGTARISRMVPGEGFAVYFTKLDDNSTKCLKKILQKSGI